MPTISEGFMRRLGGTEMAAQAFEIAENGDDDLRHRQPLLGRRGRLEAPRHMRDRAPQHVEAGVGADALARQHAAVRPRAGPAREEADEMARIVVQALAALEAPRDCRA